MAIQYSFNNSANWQLLWNGSFNAEEVPVSALNSVYPIPEITVPFLFESKILAVSAQSNSNPGNWKFGGHIFQAIQTGLLVGGQPDAYVKKQKIWLDQISIVIFPAVASTYAVRFSIPYWLRHVQLTVWEYTGDVVDTVDLKLDQIQVDLNTLVS